MGHRRDEQGGHPGGAGPGEVPEERRGQPVPAGAEQVAVQGAGQPLGDQHRPAGERAAAGSLGGVDAGQADRGPLRQVGLPVPDDLAPVAAGGVDPDLLAGPAQRVAPADEHLRVGVGVGAPQGALGDVLDVEPPPPRVEAGGLGTGQRVRGVGGTGGPQPAGALTPAGPVAVGRGQVGGRGRAGHHVRVHHAAHRPGPGHLLGQARADRSRPPGGDLDDREVDVDVGQGVTALRPPDVGAPAGARERHDGRRRLGSRATARGPRRPSSTRCGRRCAATGWATSCAAGAEGSGVNARPARASTATHATAGPVRRRARGCAWRGWWWAWLGWWAGFTAGALGYGRVSAATVRASPGQRAARKLQPFVDGPVPLPCGLVHQRARLRPRQVQRG